MAQPFITTAEAARDQSRIAPEVNDAEMLQAWRAAESYLATRVTWEDDGAGNYPPAPAALVQAANMLTARYLARRNSVEGLVGMGEFGVARIPGVDRDIEALIGPYRRVVLA